MKRKHYPVLTIFGAVVLTSLPLLLFLAFTGHQNPDDQLAELTPAVSSSSADATNSVIPRGGISGVAEPQTEKISSPKIVERPAAETRHHASAQPLLAKASQPITTPSASPERERLDITGHDIDVAPVPVPVPEPDSLRSTVHSPLDFSEAMAAMTNVPGSSGFKQNHYQATGHLALMSPSVAPEPTVGIPNAEQALPTEQIPPAKIDTASEKGRENRGQRSRADRQVASDTSSEPSTGNPRKAKDATAVDTDKLALIEDVLIQTPVENSSVSRVENLLASTRAKGWPIALVRSDLPDDVWWVQQVVGIQGNSFAARVNFGNEYSLSGSVYRMVIVFLDTPDEVRRFRIAKQFKEIPEGTRRSREFHYIRN